MTADRELGAARPSAVPVGGQAGTTTHPWTGGRVTPTQTPSKLMSEPSFLFRVPATDGVGAGRVGTLLRGHVLGSRAPPEISETPPGPGGVSAPWSSLPGPLSDSAPRSKAAPPSTQGHVPGRLSHWWMMPRTQAPAQCPAWVGTGCTLREPGKGQQGWGATRGARPTCPASSMPPAAVGGTCSLLL